MKGGSEAEHTNNELMMIVKSALSMHSCANAISLVNSREAIGDLLKLDSMVDLVIPRGSNELVKSIKEQSKMIPVLGHAEGICHVYVDKTFKDMNDCLEIIRDSKTDYPAACNAMETLLIHSDLVKTDRFHNIIQMFKSEGVNVFSGRIFFIDARISRHGV